MRSEIPTKGSRGEVSELFIAWHRFFERLDTSLLDECS